MENFSTKGQVYLGGVKHRGTGVSLVAPPAPPPTLTAAVGSYLVRV